MAPDLARLIPSRLEPAREIPSRRRAKPAWQDEVRSRVQERRKRRLGGELPLFPEPIAPASDIELDMGRPSPELPSAPAEAEPLEPLLELDLSPADEDAEKEGPRLVWSTALPKTAGEAPKPASSDHWSLGGDEGREPAAARVATDAWVLAPSAEEKADQPPLERPAGWGDRLQAAAFDLGVLAALWAVVLYFASRAGRVSLEGLRPVWPPLIAYLAFLGFLYAVYFTGTCGRTIGKIVCGLRVVDVAGRPPGYLRAFVRALLGTVGILALMLALVPIFFDPARRALHDRLLRTRVIKY